jgi:hypothetical protein
MRRGIERHLINYNNLPKMRRQWWQLGLVSHFAPLSFRELTRAGSSAGTFPTSAMLHGAVQEGPNVRGA